jgi:hypothetical protein
MLSESRNENVIFVPWFSQCDIISERYSHIRSFRLCHFGETNPDSKAISETIIRLCLHIDFESRSIL